MLREVGTGGEEMGGLGKEEGGVPELVGKGGWGWAKG